VAGVEKIDWVMMNLRFFGNILALLFALAGIVFAFVGYYVRDKYSYWSGDSPFIKIPFKIKIATPKALNLQLKYRFLCIICFNLAWPIFLSIQDGFNWQVVWFSFYLIVFLSGWVSIIYCMEKWAAVKASKSFGQSEKSSEDDNSYE
jgi:hypothetical protein